MSTVISLEHVSKEFKTYKSSFHRIAHWFGWNKTPQSSYQAIDDVSFALQASEAIALIGQNGAGKSTLLKMITGTVRPSAGRILLNGRISAVLELGLGFNPELTGRQNVAQAGGLLGYTPDELRELTPSIHDFSELGGFFDRPLRTYSSGMQARLAFSLATAKRPDILIIDEVLSVGDSYFQHKSFGRIRDFKSQGTTLLFVSHSMADVRALCDRVILLEKGRVLKDGPADEVIDRYNAMMLAKGEAQNFNQSRTTDGWLNTRSGSHVIKISDVALLDAQSGEPVKTAQVGQRLQMRITAEASEHVPNLVIGVMIRDKVGHVVWGTNTAHIDLIAEDVEPGGSVTLTLTFECGLGPGSYSISPAAVSWSGDIENTFDWFDNATVFDVVNISKPTFVGSSYYDMDAAISRE